MNSEKLIEQIKRLLEKSKTPEAVVSVYTEAAELLRKFGGKNNQFLEVLKTVDLNSHNYHSRITIPVLNGFLEFVQQGLNSDLSVERTAQIEVTSDFLSFAQDLLNDPKAHPACAAMLIGASLEEFLRNWVDEMQLSLGAKTPGLETYKVVLRENELIDKQDTKDIDSWGGIRNDAAHGNWKAVENKEKISNMLQGVNLFLRKYSKS